MGSSHKKTECMTLRTRTHLLFVERYSSISFNSGFLLEAIVLVNGTVDHFLERRSVLRERDRIEDVIEDVIIQNCL